MTRGQIPVQDTTPIDEDWSQVPTPLAALIEQAQGSPRSAAAYGSAKSDIDGRIQTLRRLRSARALTQATLGDLLGMSQSEVSRMERRSDMLLSTLRRFVEATGGELHLVVRYPDTAPVEIQPRLEDA